MMHCIMHLCTVEVDGCGFFSEILYTYLGSHTVCVSVCSYTAMQLLKLDISTPTVGTAHCGRASPVSGTIGSIKVAVR